MKVKVESALNAIDRGIGNVIFADGRVESPVSRALAGAGTIIGQPNGPILTEANGH